MLMVLLQGLGFFLPLTGGTLSGPGNLTVGGTLSVTGITTLNGQANVGSVVPRIDSTFSLGSNTLRFASIYGDGLTITNNATFGGSVTSAASVNAKLSNIAGLQKMFNIENATNTSILASWGLNLSNDQLIIGSDYGASFLLKTNSTTALTLDTSQNATFAGNILLNGGALYKNSGTIEIKAETIRIKGVTTNEDLAVFTENGSVSLNYDNDTKLSTGAVSVGSATTAGGTLIHGWITTTQANAIDNTTIATTAYVNNKIALIPAGLVFQGTWDARTAAEGGAAGNKGNPALTSGVGTTGNFYIVSNAGSVNLDGITDWKVGDWAVFIEQGASDQWEKIDNSSVLDGFGTGQTLPLWSGSGTSNTLTDSNITQDANLITRFGKTATTATAAASINHASNDFLYINGGTAGASFGDDSQSTRMIAFDSDYLRFDTAGSEKMRILSGGNVGIGEIAPAAKLDVKVASNEHLLVSDSLSSVAIKATNDAAAAYVPMSINASSLAINADSTANVGIGTDGPGAKLEVFGTGNSFRLDSAANGSKEILFRNVGTGTATIKTDGDLKLYTEDAGKNILFDTTGGEKMRIEAGGNVGIGTTDPVVKLVAIGNIGFGAGGYNGGVFANSTSVAVDQNWGLEVQKSTGVDDYNTRLNILSCYRRRKKSRYLQLANSFFFTLFRF